jgi:hypothetical protein
MSLPTYSATITAAWISGSNLVIEWTQSVASGGGVTVGVVRVEWYKNGTKISGPSFGDWTILASSLAPGTATVTTPAYGANPGDTLSIALYTYTEAQSSLVAGPQSEGFSITASGPAPAPAPSPGPAPAPGPSPVVCFLADAPVLTPAGYKPIASLREGDMVTTADGRAVAIERVSVTRVPAPSAAVNPYVIKKGQFGATENLSISPRHRVAVPGKGMVEARELGLRQQEMAGAFNYYNLELPSWKSDNMVVAGVEVESLAPVRRMVVSAAGLKALLAGKTLDAAFVAKLRSTIRPVAGGFEVPLLKKSASK